MRTWELSNQALSSRGGAGAELQKAQTQKPARCRAVSTEQSGREPESTPVPVRRARPGVSTPTPPYGTLPYGNSEPLSTPGVSVLGCRWE